MEKELKKIRINCLEYNLVISFKKPLKMETAKDKKIENAFADMQTWMTSLQKQIEETGTLTEQDSKRLMEVRDTAKRIDPPAKKVEDPANTPPNKHPMEMTYSDLFPRLDKRRDEMAINNKVAYDRVRQRWEECGRTGVNLGYNELSFLRSMFIEMFYRT